MGGKKHGRQVRATDFGSENATTSREASGRQEAGGKWEARSTGGKSAPPISDLKKQLLALETLYRTLQLTLLMEKARQQIAEQSKA